ncbi:Copine-5,Copine-8,Copine-1,Copine-2,Copine-A,Copine-4,Copine-9,Copine-7,Copine-6,Copine-3 [Mytilus edulis]|uniref:Copine-3 n=1 Tax=Mytilus edulis TaxID=6550 RepID=A0A8S3S3G7_MYTED|nr:Copine-5,Copine-8,Copine-1,Copine-2,Copine-A,Copine-4,Copine-9,Copine-7,Copine-6,Copine-3 [Mytilus edulis]
MNQAPTRGPASKVELHIECQHLIKKDSTSKSDPCVAFFMFQQGTWNEIGRTENIQNCHDPKFANGFVVEYFFEEVQKIKFEVYDLDNATPKLTDDDFLGMLECNLAQVISKNPFYSPLKKKNGKDNMANSTITVRSEEVKEGGLMAYMSFSAKKLDNKDFMGKSDPYIEISKGMPDGTWVVVHRTEVIKNTLNPTWRPFNLAENVMCGGDKNKDIKFDVFDYDNDGSHDLIGTFITTITAMSEAIKQPVSFPCINPKKKEKKRSYENSGIVHLTSFKLERNPSFLEFIYGGMQVNFTVGVDFTASNGDPKTANSLHYINPYQPNEYQQAIQAVGAVCQDYDTDKMFPALGFGAQIPPEMKVSMEFALNFNATNPYCAGIQGILDAYTNCIQQIRLYGPTNVSPIIYHVARFAEAAQKEEATKGAHAYFALLLLTDGVITDMDATRQAIVYCSGLPMSLIIVGVGNADFADMNFLDGDDGVLKGPNGQPAQRDIVQFVPFRDFKRVSGNDPNASAAELAKQVLAEVPQQVVKYYSMRKMLPNVPQK